MALTFDIISIGTLSRNPFWNERHPVRPAHATTTLIRDGTHTVLVDPSLPAEILVARLAERTGLTPGQVDAVFLTTFRPVHRRGLAAFDDADWLMAAAEIEAATGQLNDQLDHAESTGEPVEPLVEEELALLGRIQPADEKLTPGIHLFPTPGASPGAAALLLVPAMHTIAIAGDAVLTREHLEAGRILERAVDPEQALESFVEILEIADQIVPGHDNLVIPAHRSRRAGPGDD